MKKLLILDTAPHYKLGHHAPYFELICGAVIHSLVMNDESIDSLNLYIDENLPKICHYASDSIVSEVKRVAWQLVTMTHATNEIYINGQHKQRHQSVFIVLEAW